MRQSTANKRYVKRQVSVIRVYTCTERHLTFRWNIDTRWQWSVGNIGWNKWLYWEIVINDHYPGSVAWYMFPIFIFDAKYINWQQNICHYRWHMYLCRTDRQTMGGSISNLHFVICKMSMIFKFHNVSCTLYNSFVCTWYFGVVGM